MVSDVSDSECDDGIDRVERGFEMIQRVDRIEVCGECGGDCLRTSDRGGVVQGGPCDSCWGTGLVLR